MKDVKVNWLKKEVNLIDWYKDKTVYELVKLIIFDLDGVLVEAKNIHYEALNKALGSYAISWNEHLSTYDGLKTNPKVRYVN